MTDVDLEAPGRLPLSQRARIATTVLVVLAVVLVAVVAWFAASIKSHVDDRDALADAREAAVTAARQEIINLDTLNHTTIDRDLARVVEGATGTFKEQFTRARGDLKTLIVQRKSTSNGTILSAGVVRADTDTATVLVAVDRTVTDSTDPTGAVAHDRWRVDLEKHGGHWLVADLQPVA